ncbi:hypothetical protein [Hyphomicrobium sp.]|uniref:hypothetical protein n=1 Tax=Hyphomicrobium sp. TaxID=82 RepID=UPI002FDEFE51
MQKQAICYFVLGASLTVLLQNLARRRAHAAAQSVPGRPQIPTPAGSDVIDLAAWKASRAAAHALE